MKIDILTLFPEFFQTPINTSILKRAIESNAVNIKITDIRDFAQDKHRKADDRPFGGGCGMVMKAEPLFGAIESIEKLDSTKVILLCPRGKSYTQKKALELSTEEHLVFVCGHYEDIDERVRETLITDEISIGDYILTGGEIATLVVLDSIIRLLPNVLGNEDSAIEDSFSDGLLDCPHYTRPREYRGLNVPDVLVSGNHAKIEEWRLKQKLKLTYQKRPDLLEKINLDKKALKLLKEIKQELE